MAETTGNPNKLILVVDDEKIIRELLRRHLSGLGYRVAVAESGEEALQQAELAHPAVVLLDLKMPGMGGVACLRELSRKMPEVPVVVLTAVMERDTVMNVAGLGARDYLYKPVDLATVTRVVHSQLEAA